MTNRRNFIKAGLFSAMTAGLSHEAVAVPVKAPVKYDDAYDFVVIGAGNAGLSAAGYAAQAGLSVVVLEKMPTVGGSSAICGGSWAASGTQMQKDAGVKDSEEIFVEDMLKTGGHMNDPELVKAYVRETNREYEWLLKNGVKALDVHAAGGMSVPRVHAFRPSEVVEFYRSYAVKHGAKIELRTTAERLLWDSEKECVSGVRVKARGKTKNIQARYGVLLASGGFARNPELLGKYVPAMKSAWAVAGLGNTGDGLKMGLSLGADVLDTNYIKATYGFKPQGSASEKSYIYYNGGIIVNKEGKRFVNESISYKLLSDAALKQKDVKAFEFFDEAVRVKMRDSTAKYRKLLGPLDNGGEVEYCLRGNTVEEVAQKAGIDPKVLRATVDRYNDFARKGKDEDFGRTSLTSGYGKIFPLTEGPFYLYQAKPRLIATYCGLRIDPKARVIDVFGEPIPHLYACGEAIGGVHGAAYMSGSAVGKAIGFGRIAALEVAG